jgi:polar amino acid transport system substrate-binding protein
MTVLFTTHSSRLISRGVDKHIVPLGLTEGGPMTGTEWWTRRAFLRNSTVVAGAMGMGSLTLASCGSSSSNKSTLDHLRSAGSITVGYDADPPWSFTTSSGALTGIAAAVAAATYKEMGIPQMKGVLVSFGDLIPGLLANRFDSIGDSLFITPARCKQVLFSDPFVVDGEAFAVTTGNPFHISNFQSVAKNPSIRLGIIGGSAESTFAAAAGVKSKQVITFNDLPTAIAGIPARRVDAVAFDVVALRYTVKTNHAGVEVTSPFTEILNGKPQYGANAFIFRKSDGALRDAFNEAQKKVISSGRVAKISQPLAGDLRLGITQAEHLSVAQLCAGG